LILTATDPPKRLVERSPQLNNDCRKSILKQIVNSIYNKQYLHIYTVHTRRTKTKTVGPDCDLKTEIINSVSSCLYGRATSNYLKSHQTENVTVLKIRNVMLPGCCSRVLCHTGRQAGSYCYIDTLSVTFQLGKIYKRLRYIYKVKTC
jgi:hypothetical protein